MAFFDFEDEKPLVIDNGSCSLKAGWSGHGGPDVVLNSIVGRPRLESLRRVDPRLISSRAKGKFVGKELEEIRGILSLQRPVSHGKIKNWENWTLLMERVYDMLNAPMEEHPVLVTMPRYNPTKNREKLVTELFENFGVPALYVAIPSVLCLYSSGRTTGLVIGCGDGLMHSDPISEGFALHHASRTDIGGREATQGLAQLLREDGYRFSTSAEREIVRDLKQKHAYVALDYADAMKRSISVQSKSSFERDYVLPDGQVIKTGNALFRCMEGFFQPGFFGKETAGIHRLAFQNIQDAPRDSRKDLFKNILLCGGSTMAPGFADRLRKEFDTLVDEYQLVNIKPNIIAPPEREQSVWIGGSILSSLSTFDQCWFTREEYDEHGVAGIYSKFQT